jgi:hypothetical protein
MKKEKEVFKGSMDTMVKIIDWSKINETVSDTVGYKVECRIGNGIISDVTAVFDKELGVVETNDIILDTECCARVSTSKNLLVFELNKVGFCVKFLEGVGFYKVYEEETEGSFSRSIAMFPSFEFDIDIDDIKSCLTGEEMPLYLFMGERYDYNSRIRNNERGLLNLVFEAKDKKSGYLETVNKEWEVLS